MWLATPSYPTGFWLWKPHTQQLQPLEPQLRLIWCGRFVTVTLPSCCACIVQHIICFLCCGGERGFHHTKNNHVLRNTRKSVCIAKYKKECVYCATHAGNTAVLWRRRYGPHLYGIYRVAWFGRSNALNIKTGAGAKKVLAGCVQEGCWVPEGDCCYSGVLEVRTC